MTVVIV